MKVTIFFYCVITFLFLILNEIKVKADDYLLEEPTSCEVCKYFVVELQSRLEETGKSKEILRTGHGLDTRNRKEFPYKTSELRLVEAMDGICDRILEYNMHKERTGSLRFAKGRSETMETLHGLVDKGVKVELGIPYDLWDEPSVEVTIMKKQCERMLEQYEEIIEDWYFHKQDEKVLLEFLCKDAVLKKNNQSCLAETWTGKETKYPKDEEGEGTVEKKKKKKASKKKKAKKDVNITKKKGESGNSESDESGDSSNDVSTKDEL